MNLHLFLSDPVTITTPGEDVSNVVDFGDMILLTCSARGVPVPSITWSQSPINSISSSVSTDSQGFLITTSNLTISSIQILDTIYSCTANNTGRSQTRIFTFTVNCKFLFLY